jgi:hypothetical protein
MSRYDENDIHCPLFHGQDSNLYARETTSLQPMLSNYIANTRIQSMNKRKLACHIRLLFIDSF